MPFTRSWDESAPLGSSPADTIDTIIQNLKTDIRERLEGVVPGFESAANEADLALDSTRLDPPISGGGSLAVGLISARPNPPETDFYWATDEEVLYVAVGATWEAASSSEASGANISTIGPVEDPNGPFGIADATNLPPRGMALPFTAGASFLSLLIRWDIDAAGYGNYRVHATEMEMAASLLFHIDEITFDADAGMCNIIWWISNNTGAGVSVNVDFTLQVLRVV